jgi:glycerol-3-phosphate dehydrogenase
MILLLVRAGRVNLMYDMLVIGGGINGAGIARDAAGRGLKVLLCEKDDLANATSSSSSKLVHGGLRYLESYEFRLVRESLAEREILLNLAPHIIWPLRLVLPVEKGMRTSCMLRIGFFLYDHLAKRSFLPGTKTLNLRSCLQGASLKEHLVKGFEYSDCWADDARLVVLNAVDASERGAKIMTRTECVTLNRLREHWVATLKSEGGTRHTIEARMVVNAAGPWVEKVLGQFGRTANTRKLRLVKGSHIVTQRLFEGEHAYIFQSPDGRVIFAIPYENDSTLIGTTEVDWSLDQGEVKISAQETEYLCETANRYFKQAITSEDVIWSYAGVRPLFDDQNESASVVTRDYVFDLDASNDSMAPALSIFGGKLTTYRKLAEQALDLMVPYFDTVGPAWTRNAPLPGGDFSARDPDALRRHYACLFPWLPDKQLTRMTQSYGTRLPKILLGAQSLDSLGQHFGGGLYEVEVAYLCDTEFAQNADDILWRRSKLGLRLNTVEQSALAAWPLKQMAA